MTDDALAEVVAVSFARFVCFILPFRDANTAGNTYWLGGGLRTPVSRLASCEDTAGVLTPAGERTTENR